MTNLSRSIKCSNCGSESSVQISSELEMKELIIAGRCRCGNSLQITYNIVGDSSLAAPAKPASPSPMPQDNTINLEETLFSGGDIPSDTLRNLMEE